MGKELGIAIKFVRQYEPSSEFTDFDRALMLASHDVRDLPFEDKLADALTFLRERAVHIH